MKQPISYDELLAGYYGRHHHRHPHAHRPATGRHLTESAAKLFAGYYGRAPDHKETWRTPIGAISFSMDDGETLKHRASREECEEYVVQNSLSHADDEEYVIQSSLSDAAHEEYVIGEASSADDGARHSRHRGEHVEPRDEYEVDIADPLGGSAPRNRFEAQADRRSIPATASASDRAMALADDNSGLTQAPVSQPVGSALPAPGGLHLQGSAPAAASEDDFVADMQAILGGQKVYDPVTKKTVDADKVASERAGNGGPGQGSGSNSQAIFDKIAQSMQYANKYDLGTVELENRFADFDRISDLQDRGQSSKRTRDVQDGPPKAALAAATGVDSQEFLQDLDAIHRRRDTRPRTQSDSGDDPFAFLPPSSADATAAGPGYPAMGAAGVGFQGAPAQGGAAPMPMPAIQIPDIRLPNIQLPNIQMPPQMAAQSASTAVAVPPSPDLGSKFVASAVQTSFANAAEINSYFSKLGGAEFIDWFNRNLAGRDPWAQRALGSAPGVATNFRAIWDNIRAIFGTDRINLLQFVSLMSIFINEVGGMLAPVAERVGRPGHPGLAYAFDRIPGLKASYNDGGSNWTAYQCFRNPEYIAAHGAKALGSTLQNTTDARWGGHEYPSGYPTDVDPAVSGFIMEADFYKFRGRGLIQTTWRSAYLSLIRYIQAYTGTQSEILSRAHAWAGMDPDTAASVSSNSDWDALFMRTGMEIACVAIAQHSSVAGRYLSLSSDPSVLNGKANGSIWRMGRSISGDDGYADLFRRRVVAISNLLGN